MSHDSDTAETGRFLTQLRKERHAGWHQENTLVLEASGIPFVRTNMNESYLFRKGKHKADFFPSTGRWRSGNKTYRGGAKAFLEWWKKQVKQPVN